MPVSREIGATFLERTVMGRMRAPDRRRQILEVAAELFARHGYSATTTARLAKEAGITEPVLYQHFPGKLELFIALIEEVGHDVLAAWKGALVHVSDPTARLRAMLAANPATRDRGRNVYRLIFQAMTDHELDPRIAETIREHLKALHRFLAAELASLQEKNAVRIDEPPATLAWMLINVAIGAGMVQPLSEEHARFGASGPAIQRLLEDLFSPD